MTMTMKVSSVTSAAFNQNPSRARREADKQPLVITEHGKANYVLVTYADFTTNWRKSKTLLDAMADRSPDSGKDFEQRLDLSARDVAF
jgi:PHD/YefM family antitoxin component YafN of YafNO toxin-antitoxin module